jgi:hypothetical protein
LGEKIGFGQIQSLENQDIAPDVGRFTNVILEMKN